VAERYAAGEADEEELRRALGLARKVKQLAWTWPLEQAARALVWAVSGGEYGCEEAEAAKELVSAAWSAADEAARDDITLDNAERWDRSSRTRQAEEEAQCAMARDIFGDPFRPTARVDRAVLAWHDGAAVRLAEAISSARRFEDLPVLADLLEEAGLTDVELLRHLRGAGPHVFGCHALDAVRFREALCVPVEGDDPAPVRGGKP
jgi:hypothetical protein